jgi:hypothetical protein
MFLKLRGQSGVWVVVGVILGMAATWLLQARPTLATATDHADEFAIATAFLEEGLEMVYILDYRTGRLVSTGLNRLGGQAQPQFLPLAERNLAQDFALSTGRAATKPKFVMVTGIAAELPSRAGVPMRHALYVAELNSGRLCAYTTLYRGQGVGGVQGAVIDIVNTAAFRPTAPIRAQ